MSGDMIETKIFYGLLQENGIIRDHGNKDFLIGRLVDGVEFSEVERDERRIKLTDVIKIWDILHVKDTGDIGFCDLGDAVEKIVGIENDVPQEQPIVIPECICTAHDCPNKHV